MAVHSFEEIRAEAERQGQIIDEQKRAEESLTVTAEKPRSRKKKPTAAEIMQRGMDEEAADARALIEEAEAGEGIATPAAGMPPKREAEVGARRESAGSCLGTGKMENLGTVQIGDDISGAGRSDAKPGTATADADPVSAKSSKRDWVKEAYECFVKDAKDIDPTDPVKAIEVYFEKNATDALKARCKAEGKDAEGCWKFIEAIARKALHGSSGHIDPAVVYAIAMHWFEDVPKDWDKKPTSSSKPAKAAKPAKTSKPKKPAETPSEVKKEKAKAKAAKKRKSKTQAAAAKAKAAKQGFFFEMLETPVEGGTEK